MKASCKVLGLILIFLFVLPMPRDVSIAWNGETHEDLSSSAASFSVLHSNRGDYLRKVGLEGGLDHELNWYKKEAVEKWIKEGSKLEDDNPRYNNHFHNPLAEWGSAGLDDWCLVVHASGESSLLWAQDDDGQQNTAEGDWSWRTIREYYYRALTGSTDADRQINFAKIFKGLGHQMHLIQDMAVPAHTRNDAHPLDPFIHKNRYGGLFFESWAENHSAIIKGLARQPVIPTVGLNTSASYGGQTLVPITRLTDRNSYNGSNPPGMYNRTVGLAEYTNANFFSDDTLFAADCESGPGHYFPYPCKKDTNLQAFIDEDLLPETDTQSGDTTFHISKVNESSKKVINHLVQPTYYTEYLTQFPLYFRSYYLGERCHEDAVAFLVPRAVGYSSKIIDYFFRGEMDLVPDESNSAVYRIENKTPETMDGHFEIYYDNENEERMNLWEADFSVGPNARSDRTVEFDEPGDAKEPGKYMLVFRGKLGCEEDAVVGIECNCNPCAIYENFENNAFQDGCWIVVHDEEYYPHHPECRFEENVLHFSLYESEIVEIRFSQPVTPLKISKYPLLRWNIDCNNAGQDIWWGVSRIFVQCEINGTRTHTFVVYINLEEYIPDNPPFYTAETVGKGVQEIDLRERFDASDVISNLRVLISNSDTMDYLEGTIGYITLCPE